MKRFLSSVIIICMLLGLCSCKGKEQETTTTTSEAEEQTTGGLLTDPAEPVIVEPSSETQENGDTFTGNKPLKAVTFSVSDPENTKGLSTKGIGYGYGVSKDGVPNALSVENQKKFAPYGALALDTKSEKKVLYLTFDCGYENGETAKILDVLNKKEVPAAFFVTLPYLKDNLGQKMAVRMINEGHIVGNHSTTHPVFPTISRTKMAKEIENCDNYLRTKFGYTSPYFRFPTGEYSDCALELVQSIGYTSVFWSVSYLDYEVDKQPSKEAAFKTLTSRLHPGAVILLHAISSTNAEVLGDVIDWARAQGYTFMALSDYQA